MRMKLGTLKRIIREAVGEVLGEGLPPPYDVDKNLEAAIEYNKFVANLPATKAVAADRERQAANAAANIEREKARAAAWPARDKKYLAVLKALPAALEAVGFSDPKGDGAFRLKMDVNGHPGLDDPNMTVDKVAQEIAAAARARVPLENPPRTVKSKYDR